MDYMYVTRNRGRLHEFTQSLAFFGIIDLLSVAPYYIELLLHQDTVCHMFLMETPLTAPYTSVNPISVFNPAHVPLNTCIQAISLQQYGAAVRLPRFLHNISCKFPPEP
jgi:hypothetical protein